MVQLVGLTWVGYSGTGSFWSIVLLLNRIDYSVMNSLVSALQIIVTPVNAG